MYDKSFPGLGRQPVRHLRRKMWKIFFNAWYADITKTRRQSITKKVPAL